MLVNVVFTYDYDVIDVPKDLVKRVKKLQLQCDKWLYNKENGHEYWIKEGSDTKFAVNIYLYIGLIPLCLLTRIYVKG